MSFDALRADALGTYGYPREITPNIDAFAARSLVFERAYSAAPITPTSFAAIFTGRQPHRVFHRWKLDAERTVGNLFTAAGYRTAAFLNNVNLTEKRNFGGGFEDYHWFRRIEDRELLDAVTSWLGRHSQDPFFVWLHFNTPHAPYEHRQLAAHLYEEQYEGRFEKTTGGRFHTDDPRELERIRDLYDGEVFFADSLFGRLIDEVKELGLEDDTLILLTSDHGEEFYERGGFQHKSLYQEIIRVPLVIFHPDRPVGGRVSEPVSHVDLLPTLADAAGLDIPPGLDGASLLSSAGRSGPVVSEAMTNADHLAISYIRDDDKLLLTCTPQRSAKYFDLGEDPLEQRPIRPGPPRTEKLWRELRAFLGGREPCSLLRQAMKGDPAEGLSLPSIKELKALGYLD